MSQPFHDPAIRFRPGLFTSIRAQIILAFTLLAALNLLLLAAILLTGIPGTSFIGWRGREEESVLNNLSLVADLKKERLGEWIQARRQNMQLMAGNELLADKVVELQQTLARLRASGMPEDRAWQTLEHSASYQVVLQYLANLKQTYAVANRVSIVNVPEGTVLVSTDPARLRQSAEHEDYYSGTLQSRPGFIGQVHLDQQNQTPSQHFGHVVLGPAGQVIGIFVIEVNPDDILSPLLQTAEGLGASGEVVLVDQSAEILTSLKHPLADGTTAKPLTYQIQAAPAQRAAHGQNGVIEDRDYRGTPVLAAYRFVPVTDNWGWGLVVKRDQADVYASISRATLFTILISLGSLLILTFLTTLLASRLTRPLRALSLAAQRLARGDLKARMGAQSLEEAHAVAEAFNLMAERLAQWYVELDRQVRARTTELAQANAALETEIEVRQQAERAQDQLNRKLAEKNAELEQIVYVTSHDLRSPLVNIEGFGQELDYSARQALMLVQAEDGPPSAVKQHLEAILATDIPEALHYIRAGTAKMDALLSGLLRLSRLGRADLNLVALDMNAMVRTVLNAFEYQIKSRGVTVTVEGLPPCLGDENQINQVLSNLLDNALKYLDPGRPGRIQVSGMVKGEQVVYCVQDNGIGIAPEHQERIFEIFHRLNPDVASGEGLGLTIVRRIVGRHGGSIYVESLAGEGSRFYFTLPRGQLGT